MPCMFRGAGLLGALLWCIASSGPAWGSIWPEVPDERTGVVATQTSGYLGPIMPMQGGQFFDELGMKWWYDYLPNTAGETFPGYHKLYMYWKATTSPTTAVQIQADAAAAAAAYPGETIWWGMSNEPNDRGQANQAAATYADIYYHYHTNLKLGDPNCKIIGPGILNWDFLSSSVYQRGKDWYQEFRQAWYNNPTYRAYSETNYGVSYPPQDAFNFHTYDLRGVQGTPWAAEDWRYCRDQILMCYNDLLTYPEVLSKKIWLTEFAALRSGSMADNIILTRQLVGWMRQQSFMERWFWFSIHSDQYWADSNPPRLELLDDNGLRRAVGDVARELANLPLEVVVDPTNGHYQTDPVIAYTRPGLTATGAIRDALGDHPLFQLVQNITLTANTMRGRTITAGAGRIIRKAVFQFTTNYDNAKVVLVADRMSANGSTAQVWANDVYGATPATSAEIIFLASDRVRALGVGLVVRTGFTYTNPTAEWFADMNNLVLYTEPSPVRPDVDGDGDVDLEDFAYLQSCLGGPQATVPFTCRDADLDGNNVVDTADVARFRSCMSGANVPAGANCTP